MKTYSGSNSKNVSHLKFAESDDVNIKIFTVYQDS